MKSHPVSINDLARELGINPSTVSRALKDHPAISRTTKYRVLEAAQRYNYRPNILALSLKNQSSKTIGLITPEIAHHFFSTVISGIEEFAYARGYRVMICQSNEDPEREEANLQALLDHRVDGILVSVSKHTVDFNPFRKVMDMGIPLVFYDRISDELPTDRIITDDYEAARRITSHLIEKGRSKILHLAAPEHMAVGKERLRGYLQAHYEHKITRNHDWIFQCDTAAQVAASKDEILMRAPFIDAIFAVNDFTAIAAMQLLQENGFRVPQQIAVAGFGDDPIASIVSPTLTTVEQKGSDMGRECAEMLIRRIENPEENIPPQTRVFDTVLKVRASSGG